MRENKPTTIASECVVDKSYIPSDEFKLKLRSVMRDLIRERAQLTGEIDGKGIDVYKLTMDDMSYIGNQYYLRLGDYDKDTQYAEWHVVSSMIVPASSRIATYANILRHGVGSWADTDDVFINSVLCDICNACNFLINHAFMEGMIGFFPMTTGTGDPAVEVLMNSKC